MTGQFSATSESPHSLTRRASEPPSTHRHVLISLYLYAGLLRQVSGLSLVRFEVGDSVRVIGEEVVGKGDGATVGVLVDGFSVGDCDGVRVGTSVGAWDSVGLGVGADVGFDDGFPVGL